VIALVLYGIFARRRGGRAVSDRALARLVVVLVAAGAASLAWSIHETAVSPNSAFFSTFTRAWELALGAALALGARKLMGIPARFRAPLGWIGLVLIAAAAVAYSASTSFPGYAALLPCMGAALVIAAGIADRQPRFGAGRLLSVGPMRYVGDRSYTLYLWHWPALVVAEEYEGHSLSVGVNLLLLLGAFLLSIVTYAFYENPIRHMRSINASALLWPASVAAVLAVASINLHLIHGEASRVDVAPARPVKVSPAAVHQEIAAARAGRPLSAVVAAVKAARNGDAIPAGLAPPPGELLNDRYLYLLPSGCAPAGDADTTSRICTLGDRTSRRSIVVFGDSHAEMWLPAVLALARRDSWAVRPIVKSGCTPNSWVDQQGLSACRTWYRWAVARAHAIHPGITLVTGGYGGATGGTLTAVLHGFSAFGTTMKGSSTVVVADDAGVSRQPLDCLLASGSTMQTCTTSWPPARFYANDALASLAHRLGLGFLDTEGWFCVKRECPTVVGRTVVYRDTGHLTKRYVSELAGPFRVGLHTAVRREAAPSSTHGNQTPNAGRYDKAVLASGPVAYWRLTTRAPSGRIADGSGHGHQARFMDRDRRTRGDSFDGRDDYVSAPNLNLAGPFSIELWIEPRGSGSGGLNQFGSLVSYDHLHRLLWTAADGRLLTEFDGNFYSNVPVSQFGWHHVVYEFDGSVERYYVDGRRAGTQTATIPPVWKLPFQIGTYGRVGYFFNGRIHDVAFYGKALSAREVRLHYEAGR